MKVPVNFEQSNASLYSLLRIFLQNDKILKFKSMIVILPSTIKCARCCIKNYSRSKIYHWL